MATDTVQPGPGYVSVSVPVPRDVLMQAIVDAMFVAMRESRAA